MLRVKVKNAEKTLGKKYDSEYPGCAIFRGYEGTLYMLTYNGIENFATNREKIVAIQDDVDFTKLGDIYADPPLASMGNDYAKINLEWLLLPLIKIAITNNREKLWNKQLREAITKKFPGPDEIKFLSGLPESYVIYSNIMLILTEKCNTFCQAFTNHNLWFDGRLPSPILYKYAEHMGDRIVLFKRTLNIRRMVSDEFKRSFSHESLDFIPNVVGYDFINKEIKYDHEDQIKIGKIDTSNVDGLSESLADINKINDIIDNTAASKEDISHSLLMEILIRRLSYIEFYKKIFDSLSSSQKYETVDQIIDDRVKQELEGLRLEAAREAEKISDSGGLSDVDKEVFQEKLLENKIKSAKIDLKRRINNLPLTNGKDFINDKEGLDSFYRDYEKVFRSDGNGYKKLFSTTEHNTLLAKFGYSDDLIGQLSNKYENIPKKIIESFSSEAVIEPDFEEFKKSLSKRVDDISSIFDKNDKEFKKIINLYKTNEDLLAAGNANPTLLNQLLKDDIFYGLKYPDYEMTEKYVDRFSAYLNNTLCTEKKRKDLSASALKLNDVNTSLILFSAYEKRWVGDANIDKILADKRREYDEYEVKLLDTEGEIDKLEKPTYDHNSILDTKNYFISITTGKAQIGKTELNSFIENLKGIHDDFGHLDVVNAQILNNIEKLYKQSEMLYNTMEGAESLLDMLNDETKLGELNVRMVLGNHMTRENYVASNIGHITQINSPELKTLKLTFDWVVYAFDKLGSEYNDLEIDYLEMVIDYKIREDKYGEADRESFVRFAKKLLDKDNNVISNFDKTINSFDFYQRQLTEKESKLNEKIDFFKRKRLNISNFVNKFTNLTNSQAIFYGKTVIAEKELLDVMAANKVRDSYNQLRIKIEKDTEQIVTEQDYNKLYKKLDESNVMIDGIGTLNDNSRKLIKEYTKRLFIARFNFFNSSKIGDLLLALNNLSLGQCEALSTSRAVTEKILVWTGIEKIDIDLPMTDLEKKFVWLYQYRENLFSKILGDTDEADQSNVFLRLLKGGDGDNEIKKVEAHIKETTEDIKKVNNGQLPAEFVAIDKKIKDLEKNPPANPKELNKLKAQLDSWKKKNKADQIKQLEEKLKKQKEQLEEKKKKLKGNDTNGIKGINTKGPDADFRIKFFRAFLEYDDDKVTEMFDKMAANVKPADKNKWDNDVYKNRQDYFNKYIIQLSGFKLRVDIDYKINFNFIIASNVFGAFLGTPYKMSRDKIVENLRDSFPLFSYDNIPSKETILSKTKELRAFLSFKDKLESSLSYLVSESEQKDVKHLLAYLEGEAEFVVPTTELGKKNLSEVAKIMDVSFHTDEEKLSEQHRAEVLYTMLASTEFKSKYQNKTYLGLLTGARDYYDDEISEGLISSSEYGKSSMGIIKKSAYSFFSAVSGTTEAVGKFSDSVRYYSSKLSKSAGTFGKIISSYVSKRDYLILGSIAIAGAAIGSKTGAFKSVAGITESSIFKFNDDFPFGKVSGVGLALSWFNFFEQLNKLIIMKDLQSASKISKTETITPAYNIKKPPTLSLNYSREYSAGITDVVSSNGHVFSLYTSDVERLLNLYEKDMSLVYINVDEQGVIDLQKIYFRFPGSDHQVKVIDASAVEYLKENIGSLGVIKMEEVRDVSLITIEKLNSIYGYSKRNMEMELKNMKNSKITYCRLHFL